MDNLPVWITWHCSSERELSCPDCIVFALYLLLITVCTLSPLTVCLVTSTVHRTSLSTQSVLNVSKHVTYLSLPSKHSLTSDNLLQQMPSTARGVGRHFMHEHRRCCQSFSKTCLAVGIIAITLLTVTPKAIWFESIW